VYARIDAAELRDVAEKYNVEGFPHVKLFRHGRYADDYDGPHEAQALARWARKRSAPSARELKDWPDARSFLGSLMLDDALSGLVVGVFSSNASKAAATFSSVASRDDGDDVEFAFTTRPALVAEQLRGAPPPPVNESDKTDRVVVLDPEGDAVAQLAVDETTTAGTVAAFVAASLTPAVTRFDSATQFSVFHEARGPRVHALLFVDEASASRALAATDAFSKMANAERDRARHVVVPATEGRVLKHFDLEPQS